jgi:acyl-CoA reductase-like NAD-dependent aldehyde dehydrogenase
VCGGHFIGETCYAPTLLVNPPDDAFVSTREIFGPVVCVYAYSRLADAVERVNALPYGFQASVFTDKLTTAWLCADRLKASHVLINEQTAFRVDWMPFGGIDESGLGLGGMLYSMNEYSHPKMITWQT